MIIFKKTLSSFIVTSITIFLFSSISSAEIQSYKKILSSEDAKIYKEIFNLQKKSIKNKKSKEWKKVDGLIKKLKNKILFFTFFIKLSTFIHSLDFLLLIDFFCISNICL